jgi:plasminogen activator
MEDYDWIAPYVVGKPSMDNWTHRSQHTGTKLDWYFNGSIYAAYKIQLEDGPALRFHGGLEYTDVQWTASGGTYIYSTGGFRDDSGDFGPGRSITHRQQFPALVAGANAIFERGNWTFDFGAKAGLTFGAKATDDHWRRDLRFVEDVYVAPLVGVSASASHQVSDGLNLSISGKVDRIFLGRSDTSMFDIPTGAPAGGSTNESGADLLSASLQVGLKGSF